MAEWDCPDNRNILYVAIPFFHMDGTTDGFRFFVCFRFRV